MVIMHFVSHMMITWVLIKNHGKFTGAIFALLFGLVIGPLVSFDSQFTTTAAYTIAAGCAFMLDAIQRKNAQGAVIFSAVWIILGAALRFDCIFYSIAFMGVVWLFQTISIAIKNKNDKTWLKTAFPKVLWKRLMPFLLTLVLCFGIEVANRVMMNIALPGFREWNDVRTQIDDTDMPDYWTYEEEYQKIGISYNDYCLMMGWNNLDPEFFTQERMEQILEIAKEAKENPKAEVQRSETAEEPDSLINQIWTSVSRNNAFWVILIVMAVVFLFADGMTVGCAAALLGVVTVFAAYFVSIGRFVWRTEWPIWIALLCALIVLLSGGETKALFDFKTRTRKAKFLLVCCVLFFLPFYNSQSLYSKYKVQAEKTNNIAHYLHAKLVDKVTPCYETYCADAAVAMKNNKDTFYFTMGSPGYWLQQYPLYVMDTFRFNEVGAGENWGSLGQYMVQLAPMQKNFEKYGIDNHFRSLIHHNVRIAVRAEESFYRSREVYTYLREHYYPEVSFCVEEVIHGVMIGRFLNELPVEDPIAIDDAVSVEYGYDSEYYGMVRLLLDSSEVSLYNPDQAYIRLSDAEGIAFVFAVTRDDPSRILTLWGELAWGNYYSVDFAFEHDGRWYLSENCAALQMPA